MKLLTCEYSGRTFAAVSDGVRVWEAAPDMRALIEKLGGALPGAELCSGEGVALADVKLLAPIPVPAQDVVCLGMNYVDHSAEAESWGVIDPDRWAAFYGWLNDNQLLANQIDVNAGYDLSYLE